MERSRLPRFLGFLGFLEFLGFLDMEHDHSPNLTCAAVSVETGASCTSPFS